MCVCASDVRYHWSGYIANTNTFFHILKPILNKQFLDL